MSQISTILDLFNINHERELIPLYLKSYILRYLNL